MVFESVLDIVSAERGEIKRSWFIEWFYGNQLKAYWREADFVGTNIFRMVDEINQGFEIVTGANLNDQGFIDFNNINHYDNLNCIELWVMRAVESTTRRQQTGLFEDFTLSQNFATITNDTDETNYVLATRDATTSSITASSIPIDEIFHIHQLRLKSTFADYLQDGILAITKTTNLPTVGLNPGGSMLTRGASARTGRWRYLSVINT